MANPYEQLIPQAASKAAPGAARATGYEHLIPGGPAAQISDPEAAPAPSTWAKVKDAFTGELRTEFPDAPEFTTVLAQQAQQGAPSTWDALVGNVKADLGRLVGNAPAEAPATPGQPDGVDKLSAAMRSTITSNPAAALDIIKKAVPGVEAKKDKFGNVMLRVPGSDWAYLNKPGLSARDVDEMGTQTLATLPLLGFGGVGNTVGQKMLTSGLAMGGGELARQGMEVAAGSDQGLSPLDIGINAGLGSLTANGVGGKIKEGVGTALDFMTRNPRNLMRGLTEEGAKARAGEIVSEKFAKGARSAKDVAKLVPDYNPTGAPIGSPAELEARAKVLLADPTLSGIENESAKMTLIADTGGEPLRSTARWAANVNPEARGELERFTQGRYHGQADRVADMWQEIATSKMTANRSREELGKLAQQVNDKRYTAAFKKGNYGLDSQGLDALLSSGTVQKAVIDSAKRLDDLALTGKTRSTLLHLAPGAQLPPGTTKLSDQQLVDMLASGQVKGSLEFWDQVKRNLQNKMDDALAAKAPDKEAALQYGALVDMLRGELDKLVPTYKSTRSVAESFFKGRNALDAGYQFASWQGRHQNEAVGEAMKKMNPAEKELFARGFVDWHMKELPELRNAQNVVNMYTTPAFAHRVELALGPDKAEVFNATIITESVLDQLRQAFGNSTTARQLAEMGVMATGGGLAGGLMSGDPMGALTGALIGATSRNVAKAASNKANEQVAAQVAKMLLSSDPSVVARGTKIVAKQPGMLDNMLGWLKANATGEAGAAAQKVPGFGVDTAGAVLRGAAVREGQQEATQP